VLDDLQLATICVVRVAIRAFISVLIIFSEPLTTVAPLSAATTFDPNFAVRAAFDASAADSVLRIIFGIAVTWEMAGLIKNANVRVKKDDA
jgi:hypothetical protein